MPSISELRKTVQRRTSNLYDTWFTRRCSVYVTAALAPLGATPNQVSVVAALVGLGACAMMAFGGWTVTLLGVACVHLYAVLDSVDGELARLRKMYSLRGLFIEDLSAYTMINAFNLSMGVYLHRSGMGSWPLIVAIAHAAFGRNGMAAARRALMKSVATHRPTDAPPAGEVTPSKSHGLKAIVLESVLHYTNIWIVSSTLVAIEVLAGVRGLVVAGFAFYMLGQIAKEVAVILQLLRGDYLERELATLYRQAAAGPGQRDTANGLDLAG